MTDTKPRTATDLAFELADCIRVSVDGGSYPSTIAVNLLESWRRELLATDWHYLPGEMPGPGTSCKVAVVYRDGSRIVVAGQQWSGLFSDADGNILDGCDGCGTAYAWQDWPDPPPVKGE